MSGGGAPQFVIALRDGGELQVGPEGVRSADRFFALANIQDARQVSPEPETIALRVAGAGMIDFRPARQGDGALVLEALYRLRPELRPAGVEPIQGLPPGFPPARPILPLAVEDLGAPLGVPYAQPTPYPPQPGVQPSMPPYMAPPGFPPTGYPPLPPAAPGRPFGFAPNPNRTRGELTPYPRTFGEILGAILMLFGKHWRRWLALGLCVSVVPALLGGGIQILLYLMAGMDPWSSSTMSVMSVSSTGDVTFPFHFPPTSQLLIYCGIAAGLFLLGLLFSAWQAAALGIGARDALLGKPVRVGAAVGGGLRRWGATFGALLVTTLISVALVGPGLACWAIALVTIAGATNSANVIDINSQAASIGSMLSCIGFVLLIPGTVGALFFGIRLGFAPYVAGTERLGAGAAIRKSWQVTRGFWWRTLAVNVLVWLFVALVSNVAGVVQAASIPLGLLVALPVLAIATGPLYGVAAMVQLYDLRLRREGYAALTKDEAAPATSETEAGG